MLKKTIFLGLLLSGAVFQEMSAINFGKFFSKKLTAQQIEERIKYADDLVTKYEKYELEVEAYVQAVKQELKLQHEKGLAVIRAMEVKEARNAKLKKVVLIGAAAVGTATVAVGLLIQKAFLRMFDNMNIIFE